MASGKNQYRFGEFRLDPGAGWLWHGEREVELAPKAFQVLCYLVEHRDRLVPKQELLEALWKETFVTDDALVQAITAIRRALGDDVEQPRYVRTKPRVGYQFIAAVEASEPAPLSDVPASMAPTRRGTARGLFLVIQGGYVTLYSLTLFYLESAAQVLSRALNRAASSDPLSLSAIVFLALGGVTVRLYLTAAVSFDHPKTGQQFGRLFPALLLLDLVWALTPLLLVEKTGLVLALALIPLLAYGPFSQRTLIRSAYPAGGAI